MTTLDDLRSRFPGAESFTFGDSQALCDDLLARVRSGRKTATCGALRDFEEGGEAMPRPGRIDIALTWDGAPACAIRTITVEICRFDQVTEDFAQAEGEDDSLASWQQGHRAYFERNGGWFADMRLVCERFELVEDFA